MWFKRKDPADEFEKDLEEDLGEGQVATGVSRRQFVTGAAFGVLGLVAGRFLPPLPGWSGWAGSLPFLNSPSPAYCNQTCSISNGCARLMESWCQCVFSCPGCPAPSDGPRSCSGTPDRVEEWAVTRRNRHHPSNGDCGCWESCYHIFTFYCAGCC